MGSLYIEGDVATPKLHAVMMPFPAHGHITPFLQLARQMIREHGFEITFINSTFHHNSLTKTLAASPTETEFNRGITFVHISDGLPDDHPRLAGVFDYLAAVYAMEPAFNKLLLELVEKAPITCVIRDVHLPFKGNSAREAGIPVAGFVTTSAIKYYLCHELRKLINDGFLPALAEGEESSETIDWKRPITCLPGVPPQVRVEDLPIWYLKDKLHAAVVKSVETRNAITIDSDWLMINTVYELETQTVDAMRNKIIPKVCTLGPCGLTELGNEESVAWLDEQEPHSVLFLSFGTTTTKSIEQFEELAHGLENSNQKFLWVIRPEQVNTGSKERNDEWMRFFAAFVSRTKDRGIISRWVPSQWGTLRHPSIGAFVSHCGWNSAIEALSSGVPILAWPFFFDQYTIARYITDVWRTGLGFDSDRDDGLVLRDEVELKVRTILRKEGDDPQTDALRERALRLRILSEKAVTHGGSSQQSLAHFVEDVRGKVVL